MAFPALLALSIIDIEHRVVERRIVYPTLLAIGILLSGVAARDRRGTALGATAVSGAAALAALTLVALQASWRPRPHAALPLTPLVAAATLLTVLLAL